MSVRESGAGWEVRWRDTSGRLRARRFASEETRAFDEAVLELSPGTRSSRAVPGGRSRSEGVYS